jgi:hypothetical protein
MNGSIPLPFTLRQLPFTLRQLPFARSQLPFTLRQLPFARSQLPFALSQLPFARSLSKGIPRRLPRPGIGSAHSGCRRLLH